MHSEINCKGSRHKNTNTP